MAIKLTLSDAQKAELVEFYRSEIKKLDSKKKEYIDLIDQLTDQPKAAKNQLPLISGDASYDPTWPWIKKAMFVFSRTGSFLTAKEVFDKIIVFEPSLLQGAVDNARSVSATLSVRAVERKGIGRFTLQGVPSFLYGPLDWFEKTGAPKSEYIEAR